ncbi:MAG: ArsC family transcriptional regulator [Paludibacter sp.]|nr:MAG: ArsC family transcriptional regulator [Paludibacter sp.]
MKTILCYSKCSTCKKAEKWLKENSLEYQYRAIDKENPTYEELKDWYAKSELPIKRWFNTSGKLYREQNIKEKVGSLSDDELLKILAQNGMMVKRPIMVAENDIVLVGFKEEEWKVLK